MRELGATIAIRLVFGLEELREKVVCRIHELDDRIVEAMKEDLPYGSILDAATPGASLTFNDDRSFDVGWQVYDDTAAREATLAPALPGIFDTAGGVGQRGPFAPRSDGRGAACLTDLDLTTIRRELEARRQSTLERVASLAERPELGEAQGFGKRIGDGTTEAISRLTDIGVGRSLETGLARTERALAKLDEGATASATDAASRSRRPACARCPTACCAWPARRPRAGSLRPALRRPQRDRPAAAPAPPRP